VLLRLAYFGVTNALALLRLLPMSDRAKDAEILALRHQIMVLERQLHGAKVRFTRADRAFLAALLHRLPRDVLRRVRLLVRPETVLRWHRDLIARRHALASRPRRAGRPPTVRSIRVLVLRLARDNSGWGYRRAQLPFSGQTSPIRAVTFNATGDRVTSVAASNPDRADPVQATVVTWDTKQRRARDETRIPAAVDKFSFSADGRRMTVTNSNTTTVWDVTRNQPIADLDQLYVETPTSAVTALSADGRLLASSRSYTDLTIWDVDQHRAVNNLYRGLPMAMAFHPNARRLAAAYPDATIDIWNLDHTDQPVELTGRSSNPVAVAFRPGTQQLAIGRTDGTLEFWDTAKRRMLDEFHATTAITALSFSPDGRRLAVATADGATTVWDTATRTRWANPRVSQFWTILTLAASWSLPDGDTPMDEPGVLLR
jgi:WD40 repeat protein